MKDRIAEKAVVIASGGGTARVRLVGGEACRRCGAAAMGLCKPGGTGMVFDVRDPLGVRAGDMVRLSLDRGTQARGYFYAYVLPLAAFVVGGFAGDATGVEGLDVLLAFLFLSAGLACSRRNLMALDRSRRMYIKGVTMDVPGFAWQEGATEGLDYLRAYGAERARVP